MRFVAWGSAEEEEYVREPDTINEFGDRIFGCVRWHAVTETVAKVWVDWEGSTLDMVEEDQRAAMEDMLLHGFSLVGHAAKAVGDRFEVYVAERVGVLGFV